MMAHKCLRPIRINICDSTYLPAFVVVSAVASSLFVSYDLPLKFKLKHSCTSGRGAQTVDPRPQDSDSKSFHTPPTASKTLILVTLGRLAGYVCISESPSCFASTFAARKLRNSKYIPSFSPHVYIKELQGWNLNRSFGS